MHLSSARRNHGLPACIGAETLEAKAGGRGKDPSFLIFLFLLFYLGKNGNIPQSPTFSFLVIVNTLWCASPWLLIHHLCLISRHYFSSSLISSPVNTHRTPLSSKKTKNGLQVKAGRRRHGSTSSQSLAGALLEFQLSRLAVSSCS